MTIVYFDWDEDKDRINQIKHHVPFFLAQRAFLDQQRIIARDVKHSGEEERYYCIGKVGDEIMTVRFTYREHEIRIIGAGYWRKGKAAYEEKNSIH